MICNICSRCDNSICCPILKMKATSYSPAADVDVEDSMIMECFLFTSKELGENPDTRE